VVVGGQEVVVSGREVGGWWSRGPPAVVGGREVATLLGQSPVDFWAVSGCTFVLVSLNGMNRRSPHQISDSLRLAFENPIG